jgi:hypothetical protein
MKDPAYDLAAHPGRIPSLHLWMISRPQGKMKKFSI